MIMSNEGPIFKIVGLIPNHHHLLRESPYDSPKGTLATGWQGTLGKTLSSQVERKTLDR